MATLQNVQLWLKVVIFKAKALEILGVGGGQSSS